MKKVYLVGQLNRRIPLEGGLYANALDQKLGIIGLLPVFSNKKKAQAFAGTKFPVIEMECAKIEGKS